MNLAYRFVNRFHSIVIGNHLEILTGWFAGCLLRWLVGWLAGWLAGWLVGLVRSLVGCLASFEGEGEEGSINETFICK